jgi:hypothetical protein
VRCRVIEHVRWRSEHDSGASGSSSAVRWAWVCSFFVPWHLSNLASARKFGVAPMVAAELGLGSLLLAYTLGGDPDKWIGLVVIAMLVAALPIGISPRRPTAYVIACGALAASSLAWSAYVVLPTPLLVVYAAACWFLLPLPRRRRARVDALPDDHPSRSSLDHWSPILTRTDGYPIVTATPPRLCPSPTARCASTMSSNE